VCVEAVSHWWLWRHYDTWCVWKEYLIRVCVCAGIPTPSLPEVRSLNVHEAKGFAWLFAKTLVVSSQVPYIHMSHDAFICDMTPRRDALDALSCLGPLDATHAKSTSLIHMSHDCFICDMTRAIHALDALSSPLLSSPLLLSCCGWQEEALSSPLLALDVYCSSLRKCLVFCYILCVECVESVESLPLDALSRR